MRSARSTAIASGRPTAFVLNQRDRSYRVEGVKSAVRLPDTISMKYASARAASHATGETRLEFYPDGSSTGGEVVLSDRHRTIVLTIQWLTGAVVVRGASG